MDAETALTEGVAREVGARLDADLHALHREDPAALRALFSAIDARIQRKAAEAGDA